MCESVFISFDTEYGRLVDRFQIPKSGAGGPEKRDDRKSHHHPTWYGLGHQIDARIKNRICRLKKLFCGAVNEP
jgi:hypothetical protein